MADIATATSPAEVFMAFQALVKDDPALHVANVDTFSKLLQFAEDVASVNVAVRVKIIAFIAQHLRFYDAPMCKKIAQLAVKVISQDQAEDPAVMAALRLFPALATLPAEHRPDYFAREGADVVIQVVLDEANFASPVRGCAKEVLLSLVGISFKAVLTKLIHLISDDREIDDADQVQKERAFAWETLLELTKNKKEYALKWTEEVQQHFLTCMSVVLHTVPKDEFAKLLEVAANLSTVQEKSFLPLLEAYLSACKLDGLRSFEGLSMIGSLLPRTAIAFPQLGQKLLDQQVIKKIDARATELSAVQLAQLKTVVLACRTSSVDEVAQKLLVEVQAAITAAGGVLAGDALPESLTVLEGLLLSLSYLGNKCSTDVLKLLSEPVVATTCGNAVTSLEQLQQQVLFAIKKKVDASTATDSDAAALTAVNNVLYLLKPLAKRQLPSLAAFVPSWEKSARLPEMKRKAAQAVSDEPLAKKLASESAKKRQQGGGGGGGGAQQKQQQHRGGFNNSGGPKRRR